MIDREEIDIEMTLKGPLARVLRHHAERLNQAPAELFADIVETVFQDDLVIAVIDR